MNCLRSATLTGSLLSALMTTGCLGLVVSSGGNRSPSRNSSASKISQVRIVLGTLTRGQQVYYLETGEFARTIADIGIDFSSAGSGYEIAVADWQPTQVILTATPVRSSDPKFSAGVFIMDADGMPATVAVQCESTTVMPVPRPMGKVAICDEVQ